MTHVFEAANLGTAPFRIIGVETVADRASENRHREANGQVYTTNYCTSCDFCGTAIQNAFRIQGADGRTFKVGCDCVEKAGDKGLNSQLKNHQSAVRREKQIAKNAAVLARKQYLYGKFMANGFSSVAYDLPHPTIVGKNMEDYLYWYRTNPQYQGTKFYKTLEQLEKLCGNS